MARVDIVHEGYIKEAGDRVASTVGLIRDGDRVVVVDPGMVPDQRAIIDPLAALGVGPADVTDVVLSHHHPDHSVNVALFPMARVHDHWAIYEGDLWISRAADGFQLSPGVRLMETPGHTPQDITTVAHTDSGLVAFTHLWWTSSTPVEDPYAVEPAQLHEQRARLLAMAVHRIIPGHGPPFEPGEATPR